MTTNGNFGKLVLIDVKGEVDLGHVRRLRHTATAQSGKEDLRLRYVRVTIRLGLGYEIPADNETRM